MSKNTRDKAWTATRLSALPNKKPLLMAILAKGKPHTGVPLDMLGQDLYARVRITKDMANEIISAGLNCVNRDFKEAQARKLTDDINDGNFYQKSMAPIGFYVKGYVADGGHRLVALAHAEDGSYIDAIISLDNKMESVLYIDTGAKRSMLDSINFSKELLDSDWRMSALSVKLCRYLWLGDPNYTGVRQVQSINKVLEYALMMKEELQLIDAEYDETHLGVVTHLKRVYVWKAFLHYMVKDPKKASSFIKTFIMANPSNPGANIYKHPQAYNLRQWLNDNASSGPDNTFRKQDSQEGYRWVCEFMYRDHKGNDAYPQTWSEAAWKWAIPTVV